MNRSSEDSRQRSNSPRERIAIPFGIEQQAKGRIIERHSHDIYQDQVRWINRMKVEIEERYGEKVTSNAIVQLAIELLHLDYESLEEESVLMRVLVKGEPLDRG